MSARRERRADAPAEVALAAERILEPRVGWIEAVAPTGEAIVDFEGSAGGPVVARLALRLTPGALAEAAARRQGAVLLFERGDPARPIVMGLVEAPPSPTPMLDLVLETQDSAGGNAARGEESANHEEVNRLEATVDGRRVVIDGKDEIVLRCGKASITLRRNGKIVIRGTYVESWAAGTNRIKGGAVRIN